MSYKLEEVFPPKTIQLTLSPQQQSQLELISSEMCEIGVDDSFALEEVLNMGLANYLEHWVSYRISRDCYQPQLS
jgi:hypothetical protein